MYGVPDELPEDIEATFRLAYDLSSDTQVFGMCEIRPGTEIEAIAKESNMLPEGYSWAKAGELVPKFKQEELYEEEVAKIQSKVRGEYLLKPNYVLKQLIERNFRLMPYLWRIATLYISIIISAIRRKV